MNAHLDIYQARPRDTRSCTSPPWGQGHIRSLQDTGFLHTHGGQAGISHLCLEKQKEET